MKKVKLPLVAAVLLTIAFISCKKEDTVTTPTTSEKLVGIWNVNKLKEDSYSSGMHNYDSVICGPGNTIEFRSNGISYINLLGNNDTMTYKVINENKIIFNYNDPANADTFNIGTLTTNELSMTIRDYTGSDYVETTLQATK